MMKLTSKLILTISLFIGLVNAKVIEITSMQQFETVIKQENRLMIFDLYADWCNPCKQLAPILKEVSDEYKDDATIYKVNTDNLPQISQIFQVNGIPHVSFIKDGGLIQNLVGLYPKESYQQAIEMFSGEFPKGISGNIKDGVREITIDSNNKYSTIAVYRGDKILLSTSKKDKKLSLKNIEKVDIRKDGSLYFTARVEGAFAIMSGEKRIGWLLINQYQDKSATKYKEVDSKEFSSNINKNSGIVLDVRTLGEYKSGHLKDALLIPIQSLSNRLKELKGKEDTPIYIYCRSGNRSTVASKILIDAGFNKIYNLRAGINDWKRAGFSVVK